ncbi:MAG: phosphodiester glycosidase family protein [Oscillospiraceae bacterium]|nr:phosphodiester glycosidase family protein [Oscillospiraceae bacterium]
MRKFTRCIAIILAIVLLLPGYALAVGAGDRVRHDHVVVSDTLSYGHILSEQSRGRQSAHYLSFMPGGDIRPMVSAGSYVFGASNINTVINHARGQGHNVLGGINADFFSFQTGVPEGIYISNGQLRSSHYGRGAVFFREDGSAFLGNPTVTFLLSTRGGGHVDLPAFNKFRHPYGIMLLDEHFSATTRTTTPGREVFLRILSGNMAIGGTVSLEVVEISDSEGAVPIPAGHLVLSADLDYTHIATLDRFAVGDRVTLHIGATDNRLSEAVWATGGGDILVTNGTRTSGWDPAQSGAAPRTALGIRPDGSVILYTVDGRISGHSAGITLSELADEMIALGASEVINLDGGGSTTFSYRVPGTTTAAIQNRPSGGFPRACATFILLVANYGQGGGATNMQFAPGHAAVLGGSLVTPFDLATVTMTDRGYYPVATAGLQFTSYTAMPALGAQEGSAFRTAVANASGTLTAQGNNGLSGSLRLDVVAAPDRLEFRRGEQRVDALTVALGDQIPLSFRAYSGNRALFVSQELYSTNVTGNVGTLNAQTGLLTVTGIPGTSGTISVTAGGVTRTIPVTIADAFVDIIGHWAESYVNSMRDAGVVTGVHTAEGTRFYPDRNVTRVEFAAMLARRLELNPADYSLLGTEFVDHAQIPAWARPYVAAMFQHGLISGRPVEGGNVFDAGASITRAEAFTILGRLMDFDASADTLDGFPDQTAIPGWARAEIARLVERGLITGLSDGRLAPHNNLTRAEAATILARLDITALLSVALAEAPGDLYAAYLPEEEYGPQKLENEADVEPEPEADEETPEEEVETDCDE